MRLLILTQAVDTEDLVLGFFHQWIEMFAQKYDEVSVICLKEGAHNLPSNVHVYSLGKEGGASRVKYISRFFRYIWSLRSEYDAVFVHMNEEYVVLGGLLWRLFGKHIVLWRNFATGSRMTPIAAHIAHKVCYTSGSAYVAKFKNSIQMPIGIDTSLFAPRAPQARTILFLGRLDEVKKVREFIAALKLMHVQGENFAAHIYGNPTYPNDPYIQKIQEDAAPLIAENVLTMHAGIPHRETPTIFAAHDIYVNITPSGSFDKTIGEAMSCGCILVTANNAIQDVVPEPLTVDDTSIEDIARGLKAALDLRENERSHLRRSLRTYVEQKHSLNLLVEKLSRIL